MFHFLQPYLVQIYSGFNIIRYITFRSVAAAVTAFLLSVCFGPAIIRKLKQMNLTDAQGKNDLSDRQEKLVREENRGEELSGAIEYSRSMKRGIPAMGGVILTLAVVSSVLLWGNLANRYILTVLAVFISLSLVGFYDDIVKLRFKRKGIAGRYKLLWQLVIALGAGAYLFYSKTNIAALWNVEVEGSNYSAYINPGLSTVLTVPFLKNVFFNLYWVYVIFAALVIVGVSNAVNLTDGLDGLAIGNLMFVSVVYTIYSYVAGNWKISGYLGFLFIEGSGELAVLCSAIAGASLGFLWFNAYPAQVFMGDTGSLALGGAIGAVAVIIRQELLLVIAGGIFVAEALSVILQVGSFKLRGKRVFRIAPLHYHYQWNGLAEPKVIVRFWIVSAILALVSLGALKIR